MASDSRPAVDGLALSVIRALAEKPGSARRKRLGKASAALFEAALDDSRFCHDRMAAALAKLRVSDSDIVDYCIPDAARELGDGWLDDTLTFAAVSRASARLLGFCRHLEDEAAECAASADGFSILLVSLKREDHIIGPAVLAKQLRRSGNSVALMSNCAVDDVVQRIGSRSYDCLMISLASLVGIGNAAEAIRHVRSRTQRRLPIFLGGAALSHRHKLEQEIDADLVTSDIAVALAALRERRDLENGVKL